MNVSQYAKKVFVCCAAAILLAGSFLRVAMGEPLLAEAFHRAAVVAAAGGISFLWLRFPVGRSFFTQRPLCMIALLYAAAIGLMVYDCALPHKGMVERFLPAVPAALALVPVMIREKKAGLRGLFAAIMAPVPGYVVFLLVGNTAAVLVLAGFHFVLLMNKGADQEWFGDEGDLHGWIIYLTASLVVLGWGLFFDGFRVLGDAIYWRMFPEFGRPDQFIRSSLAGMQLMGGIPVDTPFSGDPYLIAQVAVRYGALLGVACTALLVTLIISAYLIEDGKNVWQSGLKLSLALPVLLAIVQNWGVHIVYVDIPLLGRDFPGTVVFLLLCVGICRAEPEDEPEHQTEADDVLIRIETCHIPDGLEFLRDFLDGEEQEKIRKMFEGYPSCTMVEYQGTLEEICLDLEKQIYGTKDVLVILVSVPVGTSNGQLRQLAEALRDATVWKYEAFTSKILYQNKLSNKMILTLLTV